MKTLFLSIFNENKWNSSYIWCPVFHFVDAWINPLIIIKEMLMNNENKQSRKLIGTP